MIQQPTYPPPYDLYDVLGELWRTTLFELRLQMTKATFNTWLADSFLLPAASSPAFWVVVVRNEYASEWLTYRLYPVIERTVLGLVQSDVTICFVPRTMRRICRESTRRSPSRIYFETL
jgi:chromosomal replication initiation ATPase DnaA